MFPIFAGNSASTGYNLTRSLRWRNSASAYLNRTPASATNRQTWTWSAWVKLTPYNPAVGGYDSWLLTTKFNGVAPTATTISINTNYKLVFASYDGSGGSPSLNLVTTQVFRDYSSWYHIVVVADTTQATAANRAKMYVNGVQITSFSTATYPAQNYNTYINNNDVTALGALYYSGGAAYSYLQFLDSYMAEMNFIDGQALTPSSFGSTNALTGVWQPARYTGTYGTNGFYLPFTDNSALTTSSNVGLGKDFSGNGNYWTTNNISITAGVTYDSMTDVPTLTSATAANYCVWNPLSGTSGTMLNGNLYYYGPNGPWMSRNGTMVLPPSTKIYFEATVVVAPFTPRASNSGYQFIGVGLATNFALTTSPNSTNVNACGIGDNGYVNNFASSSSDSGTTIALNNVIGVAIDTGANTYVFYVNNVSVASGTIGVTAGTALTPFIASYSNDYGSLQVNFGQRPFSYTPPTGFVALNTFNLPTSTIVKGNTVMDATLYTGTLLSNSITNAASFKPDLVWVKSRSAATNNELTDSVRGVTKALISNSSNAETTDVQGLTAFNTNGFTVGTDTNYNNLSATYVGWQWQAGQGSSSSNTNGSITSTVSVNASAGFSVATYTSSGAAGSAATVGHGLGVAPAFIIVKSRNDTFSWQVYHVSLGNANSLNLNLTSASGASTVWNNTTPTSSVFSIASVINYTPDTYVAYCWTPIAGYSAFGSYTGTANADGPMIYTGFKPKLIMTKRTDSTSAWYLFDSARNPYNVVDGELAANTSGAEATGSSDFDFLSNGFKCRNTSAGTNASGGTYIYMAFAANPFKNSLGF